MKKLLIVLCILILVGCEQKPVNIIEDNQPEQQTESQELVNVITTVDSLDKLKEVVGFELNIPESIDNVTEKEINAFETLKMAEVVFKDKAVIRKIAKENLTVDSLSGVYLDFDDVKEVDGYKLSSEGGYVYVCEWEKDGFVYSVNMLDGVEETQILEVAKSVI